MKQYTRPIVKSEEFLTLLRTTGRCMVLLDQDRHYLQRLERYCIKNGITEVTPEACLGCVSEVAEIKIDAFATTGSVQIDSYLRTYKMYLSYLKSGKANCALLTRARPTEITAPYAREFLSAFRTSGQRCYRFARCFHAMLRLSSFCRTKSIETVTEQTCLDCVSDLLGYRLDAFRITGISIADAMLRSLKSYLAYIKTGKITWDPLVERDTTKCIMPISGANEFLQDMRLLGYRKTSLSKARYTLDRLGRFCMKHNIRHITKTVCLRCISDYYQLEIKEFKSYGVQKVNDMIHLFMVFLHFLKHGKIKAFNLHFPNAKECPEGFLGVYASFRCFLEDQHFSDATIRFHGMNLVPLFCHLSANGISDIRDVKVSHVLDYYKMKGQHLGDHSKSHALSSYRRFFAYAFLEEYIDEDLASQLPHYRMVSDKRIPYAWRQETVIKLIQSMGRSTPTEKRDYAIVLCIARLGLRQHDVQTLRISNLDFDNDRISLVMKKTGKPLSLPLFRDVGWAILDYLQHGRPKVDSDIVFIKHIAPFGPIPSLKSLGHVLKLAKTKAGVEVPIDVRSGLHSLRSTLARRMLEEKAPLPVISGVLGHTTYASTTPYLKIDTKGLSKCAIDPEEVMA